MMRIVIVLGLALSHSLSFSQGSYQLAVKYSTAEGQKTNHYNVDF